MAKGRRFVGNVRVDHCVIMVSRDTGVFCVGGKHCVSTASKKASACSAMVAEYANTEGFVQNALIANRSKQHYESPGRGGFCVCRVDLGVSYVALQLIKSSSF